MQWIGLVICSGMTVKNMGMLGVRVKKMKALTGRLVELDKI
jgi:hypothetical protein